MAAHSSNQKTALRTIYFSIIGNTLLAVLKGITGVLGNSFALIADAIESSADVFSSLLVWAGLRYSYRPPDKNHPYGHGRAETLATFLVVVFLVMSATVIAYQSIQNIGTSHSAPKPYTLLILGSIILWKEFSFQWVMRKSRQTNSSLLKADAWHHRSDAITSVAAFIGISIAIWMGPGYESADDWAALLASGFILYNSYLIFRPILGEIMDEHLHEDLVEQIRKISSTVIGIVVTEKCLVRKTGMSFHIELHAVVDGSISVAEGHAIAHHLKDTLKDQMPELGQVVIHVEPEV